MSTGAGSPSSTGHPLRSYLAALLALFVVAAAVALGSGWIRAERDGLEAARADAEFGAGKAADQIGDNLAVVRSSVGAVASNAGVGQVFTDPAACQLSFALSGNADDGHLDVMRTDGTVVCSSRPPVGDAARVPERAVADRGGSNAAVDSAGDGRPYRAAGDPDRRAHRRAGSGRRVRGSGRARCGGRRPLRRRAPARVRDADGRRWHPAHAVAGRRAAGSAVR